jgi:hypothetical protein
MGRKHHYLRRARERRPAGERGEGGGGEGENIRSDGETTVDDQDDGNPGRIKLGRTRATPGRFQNLDAYAAEITGKDVSRERTRKLLAKTAGQKVTHARN